MLWPCFAASCEAINCRAKAMALVWDFSASCSMPLRSSSTVPYEMVSIVLVETLVPLPWPAVVHVCSDINGLAEHLLKH